MVGLSSGLRLNKSNLEDREKKQDREEKDVTIIHYK